MLILRKAFALIIVVMTPFFFYGCKTDECSSLIYTYEGDPVTNEEVTVALGMGFEKNKITVEVLGKEIFNDTLTSMLEVSSTMREFRFYKNVVSIYSANFLRMSIYVNWEDLNKKNELIINCDGRCYKLNLDWGYKVCIIDLVDGRLHANMRNRAYVWF